MAPKKRVAHEADSQYTPHKRVRDEAPVDPSNRPITRLTTIDSPRKAVFNTSELLEGIVVHLPMKDIFIIQRVCQRFKNIITTSPTIQTKLFLRLENKPREAWKAVDYGLGYRKVNESNIDTRKHITPVTLNPILEMSWFPSIVFGLTRGQLWSSIDTGFKNEYVQINFGAGHLGTHPSFLKTYIADPPCYRACIGLSAGLHVNPGGPDMMEPGDSTVMSDIIENTDGLTLGDVIHARTTVELSTPMLGQLSRKDISLWEMMAEYGCKLIVKPESRPACTLMLLDVCLPTEAQRAAVSSERSGAST